MLKECMEYTHLGHKELINKSSRLLVGFIQEYKSRLSLYLSGKNFSLLLFVKGRTVISKQWLFTVSLYSAVPSITVSIENIKGVHRIYSFGHKELAKKSSKPLTIFFSGRTKMVWDNKVWNYLFRVVSWKMYSL